MNFYLTGIEGMPKLLKCAGEDPLQYFKKKLYPDAFRRMYEEHKGTLDAIEQGYNMVIDKEQFITNMAEALISYAVEQYNGCKKKSEQERMQMDLNLTMAVYVLPMVLEFRGNSSQPLCDKLVEGWKREFPKSQIQAAEFAYIEQGFHKKFCYITTAVCETFGKPDSCYELTVLRDYRDNYLMQQPEGEAMIQKYYDVAPSIVKHINQRENAREIYQSIWDKYLSPCIRMIEDNQMEECQEHYKEMVYTLADEYFQQ